jgi:hypothetical protein
MKRRQEPPQHGGVTKTASDTPVTENASSKEISRAPATLGWLPNIIQPPSSSRAGMDSVPLRNGGVGGATHSNMRARHINSLQVSPTIKSIQRKVNCCHIQVNVTCFSRVGCRGEVYDSRRKRLQQVKVKRKRSQRKQLTTPTRPAASNPPSCHQQPHEGQQFIMGKPRTHDRGPAHIPS